MTHKHETPRKHSPCVHVCVCVMVCAHECVCESTRAAAVKAGSGQEKQEVTVAQDKASLTPHENLTRAHTASHLFACYLINAPQTLNIVSFFSTNV